VGLRIFDFSCTAGSKVDENIRHVNPFLTNYFVNYLHRYFFGFFDVLRRKFLASCGPLSGGTDLCQRVFIHSFLAYQAEFDSLLSNSPTNNRYKVLYEAFRWNGYP